LFFLKKIFTHGSRRRLLEKRKGIGGREEGKEKRIMEGCFKICYMHL
jgi:hypothetical protein